VAELEFPRVENPTLSIVMLTRDDFEWAPRALHACLEHTDPCYELIVVDNRSTDGTREYLTNSVQGITLHANDRNYGFGVSNNLGASQARGRYLLFLNSDVLVQPGWLPPLLRRLDGDETIAAVGPRLLNLDGSLQLAAALLSRAGATVSYGEGDDPDRPEYTFPRDVDYCSGACLLVRRSAFNDVGGFDPVFGLIYFEDADLCLSLWQLGCRTVYEPASTVTHVGGRGNTPPPEVLQLAQRNRSLFERRWRALLAQYPFSPLPSRRRVLAARDTRSSDRVLVLNHARCADLFARTFPSARITLAGAREDDVCSSIEHVDDADDVLRDRRFHYDAVVGTASTLQSRGAVIEQTQPQAALVRTEDLVDGSGQPDRRRLIQLAAAAGVAASPLGKTSLLPKGLLG
jgi:GT2 family glycosyltransferase